MVSSMAAVLLFSPLGGCALHSQTNNLADVPIVTRCPEVYVALGDSTGSGVGAGEDGGYVSRVFTQLQQICPATRLVNTSKSGATTADVLRYQVAALAETRPTLITLGIGANDVTHNVGEAEFTRNYEQIIQRFRQESDATIVVMNVPDVSLAPVVPDYLRGLARQRVTDFNRVIAGLGAKYNLQVVDLFARSAEFAAHREHFAPDGFHPSAQGYQVWANLLWPTLEKALKQEIAANR